MNFNHFLFVDTLIGEAIQSGDFDKLKLLQELRHEITTVVWERDMDEFAKIEAYTEEKLEDINSRETVGV